MSSYLGGLASLERWKGLKEWHRRHQELLGGRELHTSQEECTQLPTVLKDIEAESMKLPKENSSKVEEIDNHMLTPPLLKHDLSIIPEADEDCKSRDGDLDSLKSKQGLQKNRVAPNPKTDISHKTKDTNLLMSTEGTSLESEGISAFAKQGSLLASERVQKTFLRRGQGLVKYNLRPEDVKHPYRKDSAKKSSSVNKKELSKPMSFALRHQESQKERGSLLGKSQPAENPKARFLTAPMQRLALSKPIQKSNSIEIGTWSQVLGGDTNSTTVVPESTDDSIGQQFPEENVQKHMMIQPKPGLRNGRALSPLRKTNSSNKRNLSLEEDQDSLAAYLDLEQHVGNASFCSTSSKVDRLVTKSSNLSIHQSNPDAITQSKQLTPNKTGRKFFSSGSYRNTNNDHDSMWSASDLENLIKTRAQRSGSLIKAHPEPSKGDTNMSGNGSRKTQQADDTSHSEVTKEVVSPISLSGPRSFVGEHQEDIGWMLPARKPHLMKTMPSLDLDSSLIKNALSPSANEDEESNSGTEFSSASPSSEEDFEDFTSGMNDCLKIAPSKQPSQKSIDISQISKEKESSSHAAFKLVDDATLDEINLQIESHLSTLRDEIETLQSAKSKTQKYTASLEKKVQDLENRLILEARSFNKRLEEEREAAAKKLCEEQGKSWKEKQALQRALREERRKAPDPISQQELLNLKQEIAKWEEKWRADRAKARGLESNLRIQISNLKRENEKLKEENNKLRREKETAVNTAKAKSASNTRVINSIAQQLGSNKLKASSLREENPKDAVQMRNSAYNLKSVTHSTKSPKPVTTIDSFPSVPNASNEWSSDEDIDLGNKTSDEDDIAGSVEVLNINPVHSVKSCNKISGSEEDPLKMSSLVQETIDLQEAQAKYDAMFGNAGIESNNCTVNIADSAVAKENQNSKKFAKLTHHPDGKVEQLRENGTRVVTHPDGTWRRYSASGSVITVPPSGSPVHILYFNGDQLEKLNDGITRYFYAKTNVWQTTYPDGHEELQYPNGQVERREKDGSVKIILPGNGREPSATISNPDKNSASHEISVEKLPNGDSVITLPNGERELHTQDYMRKEFLDGTIKFLFKDGSQETRYPSGRIRAKDAAGNLVRDTSVIS